MSRKNVLYVGFYWKFGILITFGRNMAGAACGGGGAGGGSDSMLVLEDLHDFASDAGITSGASAGGGGGGTFRCMYSGCVYDCQRRAPMRVPCVCGRLVCRKCAGIVGSGPDGCALCGAVDVSYTAAECKVDMGILLALSSSTCTEPAATCADCAKDSESEPASYECYEAACELRALCDAHALLHRKRGHRVGPFTRDGGPSADLLGAVSHCTSPDHGGPMGVLTHYCVQCRVPTCATCGLNEHSSARHQVVSLAAAAAMCVEELKGKEMECDRVASRLSAFAADIDSALQTAEASLEVALAKVEVNAEAVLRHVQAQKAKLIADLRSQHGAYVSDLHARLEFVVGAVPELRTLQAACTAALASSDPMVQVHVSASVAASHTCFPAPMKGIKCPGVATTPVDVASISIGEVTRPRTDVTMATCALLLHAPPRDACDSKQVAIAELRVTMGDGLPGFMPLRSVSAEVYFFTCRVGGKLGLMCNGSCTKSDLELDGGHSCPATVTWARPGVYAACIAMADAVKMGHGMVQVMFLVGGKRFLGDLVQGPWQGGYVVLEEPSFTSCVATLEHGIDDLATVEQCCFSLQSMTPLSCVDPETCLSVAPLFMKVIKHYAAVPVIAASVLSIFKDTARRLTRPHCVVPICKDMHGIVSRHAHLPSVAVPLIELLSVLAERNPVRLIYFCFSIVI